MSDLRLSQPAGRWLLAAVVIGSGMTFLDGTVVNVALPAIGKEFDTSLAGLQWTANGYTLTLAALILLGGALGDRYGRRKVFLIGVVWFAVASLLCGLAPDIGTLIAARALQGIGGALLTPGSLALIQASYAREDRARAIGAWSGLGGIAGALGPLLGGWLVEAASWRWAFFINVPLAAAVLVIALRHVPESRDESAGGRFDWAGSGLGALGLAGLTYALIAAAEDGTPAVVVAASTVAGVVGCAAFVMWERRVRNPMLPMSVFASRQFTAANLVTFAVYAALGGVFFFLVLELQVEGGVGPVLAGMALLPVTVIMLLLSERSGKLAQHIGPRIPMTVGPAVSAGGLLLMLRIGADASFAVDVLPAVSVFGLGLAITVAPLTATVLGAADTRHAGVSSGVNNAVARAAGLLAVAALPLVVGLSGDDYRDPEAFGDGFRGAVLVCTGLLVVGAVLAWATIRSDVLEDGEGEAEAPFHCAVGAPPLQAPDH
ncbi:Multidrug resistance protein Stp [Streptomyces sp. RB5]|uniref:Multidrug resistance protein Stp n=1 Tax=Streptomyces smaragdinus TaxID=2585196 RepID=A0A7K0CKR8_9ACTN|nr:MFS transporter [Streptomyces smaragdinus]MQY13364.1 Multidrug resistance protein Stp [Streptomyces smaragdinus]